MQVVPSYICTSFCTFPIRILRKMMTMILFAAKVSRSETIFTRFTSSVSFHISGNGQTNSKSAGLLSSFAGTTKSPTGLFTQLGGDGFGGLVSRGVFLYAPPNAKIGQVPRGSSKTPLWSIISIFMQIYANRITDCALVPLLTCFLTMEIALPIIFPICARASPLFSCMGSSPPPPPPPPIIHFLHPE